MAPVRKTTNTTNKATTAKKRGRPKKSVIKTEKIEKKEPINNINFDLVNKNLLSDEPQKEDKVIAKKSVNLYKRIAINFVFLTVVLFIVVAYFSFSRVTILVTPKVDSVNDNLIVDVYDNTLNTTIPKRSVLGAVRSVEVSKKEVFNATGEDIVGEEILGSVKIFNNYTKNQPLVATTRLLSPDNKLFRVKETVNIPAGGSVEVEIYADKISQDMALEPTKFTIPGLWSGLHDKIYAENEKPFVYQNKVKKYIRQIDIDNAHVNLSSSLIEQAKQDIGREFSDYSQVIYNIDENDIDIIAGAKEGDEVDTFEVAATSKVNIVAFNEDEIMQLASDKVNLILSENKILSSINKEQIVYNLDNFDAEQGIATLNVSFEGKITLQDEAEIIDKNKIVNLSRSQLEDYLENVESISDYDIRFYPSFIGKVPNLVDRIKIKVQ